MNPGNDKTKRRHVQGNLWSCPADTSPLLTCFWTVKGSFETKAITVRNYLFLLSSETGRTKHRKKNPHLWRNYLFVLHHDNTLVHTLCAISWKWHPPAVLTGFGTLWLCPFPQAEGKSQGTELCQCPCAWESDQTCRTHLTSFGKLSKCVQQGGKVSEGDLRWQLRLRSGQCQDPMFFSVFCMFLRTFPSVCPHVQSCCFCRFVAASPKSIHCGFSVRLCRPHPQTAAT